MTRTPDAVPIALAIAGSDSGGGAGVQADLKTFQDHGVHGTSAIAAVTAQNTRGVMRVDPVPIPSLLAQLEAVFDDFEVHAIKVGMLGSAAHAEAVAEFLRGLPDCPPIVLDPVMVSTSGTRLLAHNAIAVIRDQLLPLATIATPNLDEACVLGEVANTRAAVEAWATQAPCPILLTGGDEGLDEVVDVLVDGPAVRRWRRPRRDAQGPGFHGTGCSLSSAIAARLARGTDLEDATVHGLAYVQSLLNGALAWNPGHGQRVLPHGLLQQPAADRVPLQAPWSDS